MVYASNEQMNTLATAQQSSHRNNSLLFTPCNRIKKGDHRAYQGIQ